MSLTYATTFSGIGGWELGLNACGWQLQWQCEREPFCQALLRKRFGVPICPDIHGLVSWVKHKRLPRPDAIIGSPPCQPFSVAGAQGGIADKRHLYPAFIAAVRKLQPRYVLMEQVTAILSMDGGRVFGEYIGGLVALGYDLVWHCLPACAVGAPHQRDRLWIVAHSKGQQADRERQRRFQPQSSQCSEALAYANSQWQPQPQRSFGILGGWPGNGGKDVAYAERKRGRGRNHQRQDAAHANTCRKIIGPRCDFKGWATEPGVGRVVNGFPGRLDRLRGLGNAVLPQIPFLIGQAINQLESSR